MENNNHSPLGSSPRKSNIELLRIVAMLMVLVLHTRYDGILSVYGGIVDASHISKFLFEAVSIIGVNLFVLISGYFGIKLKKVSVLNLLFQIYWFALIGFIGCCLLAGSIHVGAKQYMKLIFALSHNVWFVPCYFILMLISPMLNCFIEDKTIKQLAIYTSVLYVITYLWNTVFQCIQGFDGYGWGFFIILYLIGAIINKWEEIHKVNRVGCLVGYIVCTIAIVTIGLIQNYIPVGQSLLWAYNCPLVLCSSICLFLFFISLDIKNNIVINTLASSSFAVLLFHLSSCSQYFNVCGYIYTTYQGVMVLFLTLVVVIVYYLIALLLDQPRKILFNIIKSKLN